MIRRTEHLAILFADVCGSTRMYCTLGDEQARRAVDAALRAVTALVSRHRGRTVKTLGDEVMCAFENPNDAVEAACAMQLHLEAAPDDSERVAMHMGVHYGPTLTEGGDVFGDTVNAASHLCAAASAGQILIADQTVRALRGATRERARPLFFAVLKGNSAESTVYRVLWHSDTSMLTDVNLRRHNLIPPDAGGMLVRCGNARLRIDARRPLVALGRDPSCDLQIEDGYASRRHATLALRRTQVFLTDSSVNGTFVRRAGGSTAHVFRSELLLDGACEISLGRAFDQGSIRAIRLERDKRALYRV